MEKGIEEEICNHFSLVFLTKRVDINEDEVLDVILKQITEQINAELVREVTDQEVKVAAFQLGEVRATNPNGLPGLFYQRIWQTVGPDIITAVQSFLRSGDFPPL